MIEAHLAEEEPDLAALLRLGLPEPDRSLRARIRLHALGLGAAVAAVTIVTLVLAGPATAALVGCLAASTVAAVVTAVTVQHHEPFLDYPHLW